MKFARPLSATGLISLIVFVLMSLTPGAPPAFAEELRPVVVVTTSLGTFKIELDADKAPKSVANFLVYTDAGFYDGTVFHRVIPNFMIQGGGMTTDLTRKKTQPPVVNEAKNGLRNERGTVAMARTANKDSATSQFFVNLKANSFLDHGVRDYGYAIFGKVSEGMDVVDKIAASKTSTQKGMQNVPVEAVVIESIKRAE